MAANLTRRTVLGTMAALMAMPAVAGRTSNARPDMILVLMDDPDWRSTLQYMPSTRAWLCNKGCEFVNVYTEFSLCSPGRAALLTGQNAAHTGIIGEDPSRGGWGKFDLQADSTILTWAKAAGYRVGIFGHLMNDYVETSRPPPGADVCGIFCSAAAPFKYYGQKIKDAAGNVTQTANTVYSTTLISDMGVDFISTTAPDQPLLLIVMPLSMHGSGADPNSPVPDAAYLHTYDAVPMPIIPNMNEDVSDKPLGTVGAFSPVDLAAMDHEWKMRRGAGRSIDDMNMALITAMKTAGRWNNAHMAVTGDNGISLGSHCWRGKVLTYDDSNRNILAWRAPNSPTTGQTRTEMVSTLDVVATMVDVMGLAPDRAMDGLSLAPIVAGDIPTWRAELVLRDNVTWALRTADGWMYAETDTLEYGHEVELYDMAGQIAAADPYQNRNVAGKPNFAAKQAELAGRLAVARTI